MNENEIKARLDRALATVLHEGDAQKVIDSGDTPYADLDCLDSLDEIEMIMAVEDAFDIEISDEDAETLFTSYNATLAQLAQRMEKA